MDGKRKEGLAYEKLACILSSHLGVIWWGNVLLLMEIKLFAVLMLKCTP